MNRTRSIDELASTLGRLLVARSETLAVAESLTCGQLVAAIGAVTGASRYLRGSVTAYELESKVRLLGVNRDHAAAVQCVSARVAAEMAAGTLRLFETNWSVATTGYAEPAPESGFALPGAFVSIWYQAAARCSTERSSGDDVADRNGGNEVVAERVTVDLSEIPARYTSPRLFAQREVARMALTLLVQTLEQGLSCSHGSG